MELDGNDGGAAALHEDLMPSRRLAATPVDGRIEIERAKGVLMGRYLISEPQAHAMLRRHARNSNQRLHDVAMAVLESHMLLGDLGG